MSTPPDPYEPPPGPSDDRSRTPWAVHLICYLLLGGLLVYVLIGRYARPLVLQGGIGVDSDRTRVLPAGDLSSEVDTRIDPNVAPWTEMDTVLPEIGEVTAKRIVAYREAHRPHRTADADGTEPPAVFTCPEDLQAVRGIGPKTVAKIAPHLVFSSPPPARSTD